MSSSTPRSPPPPPSTNRTYLPPPPPRWLPLWACNVLQTLGVSGSVDGVVLAEGVDFTTQRPGEYLQLLSKYSSRYGGMFKVILGPKAFLVVSDPVSVRAILAERAGDYDKGLLSEVLEEIMGQGLIPARFEVWKRRRREIVPGFHKAWIARMVETMGECTSGLLDKMERDARRGGSGAVEVDMEAGFGNVALDIIGKAVFNFDFGSVDDRSEIVEAVYQVLQESEHRAMFVLPYWKDPLLRSLVPRQRQFTRNMALINDALNAMIAEAIRTQEQEDVEQLERRDYHSLPNPSLLRFLVDLRGADVSAKQLRDDMMTMLIAGHETTASVLTWSAFCLTQHPDILRDLQREVDAVLGTPPRLPTIADVHAMDLLRRVVAESLRLYPQPPLLIRRAVRDTLLPTGGAAGSAPVDVREGVDLFIPTWSLHRSPALWERPDTFDPGRWTREFAGSGEVDGWRGRSVASAGMLYPNEVSTDFAFVPFGGGPRKCVGDQFGFLESAVVLALLVARFDFELSPGVSADDVGMVTGATIHTRDGLPLRLTLREAVRVGEEERHRELVSEGAHDV